MAGLYIHIPFCRQACTYCDFHYSISTGHINRMLSAITMELGQESGYLGGEELETIYFGGGTPSLLTPIQINSLMTSIRSGFIIQENAEISLEANPDDLGPEYLFSLREAGINRLSIGIQSFRDSDLALMNRRHISSQSHECLKYASDEGFERLSIDLIYGFPGMDMETWKKNLEWAIAYDPGHIAAYHLTYEEGTVLDYRLRKRRIFPLEENYSLAQYELLCNMLEDAGYEHYEISNFARPGQRSKHNSAYWEGKKYLGAGPSAHSYNKLTRRWNLSANTSYIKGVMSGLPVYEEETIDKKTRFHDYLLTSLRTSRGLDLRFVENEWGSEWKAHIMKKAEPFINSGKLFISEDMLSPDRQGMLISDHIIRDLFL